MSTTTKQSLPSSSNQLQWPACWYLHESSSLYQLQTQCSQAWDVEHPPSSLRGGYWNPNPLRVSVFCPLLYRSFTDSIINLGFLCNPFPFSYKTLLGSPLSVSRRIIIETYNFLIFSRCFSHKGFALHHAANLLLSSVVIVFIFSKLSLSSVLCHGCHSLSLSLSISLSLSRRYDKKSGCGTSLLLIFLYPFLNQEKPFMITGMIFR